MFHMHTYFIDFQQYLVVTTPKEIISSVKRRLNTKVCLVLHLSSHKEQYLHTQQCRTTTIQPPKDNNQTKNTPKTKLPPKHHRRQSSWVEVIPNTFWFNLALAIIKLQQHIRPLKIQDLNQDRGKKHKKHHNRNLKFAHTKWNQT